MEGWQRIERVGWWMRVVWVQMGQRGSGGGGGGKEFDICGGLWGGGGLWGRGGKRRRRPQNAQVQKAQRNAQHVALFELVHFVLTPLPWKKIARG